MSEFRDTAPEEVENIGDDKTFYHHCGMSKNSLVTENQRDCDPRAWTDPIPHCRYAPPRGTATLTGQNTPCQKEAKVFYIGRICHNSSTNK